MGRISSLLLAGTVFIVFMNTLPQLMPPHIRGAVSAFNGHVLQVKTRDGRIAKVAVTDDTTINMMTPLALNDLKQGSFVGITTIRGTPGAPLRAREVHVFPEEQRCTGEGHYDWDLEPGASMTNASIEAVVDTDQGKELTLGYKGGSQKIMVAQNTPIVTFAVTDRSQLKAGTQVFVATQVGDGRLAAQLISVGQDGMRPPM